MTSSSSDSFYDYDEYDEYDYFDYGDIPYYYKVMEIQQFYDSLTIFGDDISKIILSYIFILPNEYKYSILHNNEIYEQMKKQSHNLLFLTICINIEYFTLNMLEQSRNADTGMMMLTLINEQHYNTLLKICNIQLIDKTSDELKEWYSNNINRQLLLEDYGYSDYSGYYECPCGNNSQYSEIYTDWCDECGRLIN